MSTSTDVVDKATRQIEQAHTLLNGIANVIYTLSRETATTVEPEAITTEPEPGSVVLLHGLTGSAYQRLHSDGRYHCAVPGSPSLTFDDLLAKAVERDPNGVVYLIHRGVA